MSFHSEPASSQCGMMSLLAIFFAIVIGGLSVAMIEFGLASRRMQARADASLYAMETAETGLVQAELEVAAQTDPDGDGIGTVSGTYAGSRFFVTATKDPAAPDRYLLVAQGRHQKARRRIETCVKLLPGSAWDYGMFAQNGIVFSSNGAATDAYDSRLGTYESQQVNGDKNGKYALAGGSIGSNGTIDLSSQVTIRGNANPGPGENVVMSNNAVVSGDTTPLSEEVDLPPTPFEEFQAASVTNDNGKWNTKSKVNYDSAKADLSVGSGNVLTLTGKVYFFHSLTLSGGATLRVTNGPVKIYVTDLASLGGGAIANETGQPFNLQIYQQPYALPKGVALKYNKASMSGGTGAAFVMYAPTTEVTISGNGGLKGAVIAGSINMKGGAQVHFDLALRDQMRGGRPKVQRLYWRDLDPPQR